MWLTQLGLSVALPLVGCILVAVWLRNRFDWGTWVIWVGVILGLISASDGLRVSLKAMDTLVKDEQKGKPPVSFNDHE